MQTSPLIRRYLASTILIVVACHHFYQNRTVDRSAWGTGCGFGMFSTVECHATRLIKCRVATDEGEKDLKVPHDYSLRARALPTPANLQKLADGLLIEATRRWPSTSSVNVTMWKTNFDGETRTLTVSRAQGAESSIAAHETRTAQAANTDQPNARKSNARTAIRLLGPDGVRK